MEAETSLCRAPYALFKHCSESSLSQTTKKTLVTPAFYPAWQCYQLLLALTKILKFQNLMKCGHCEAYRIWDSSRRRNGHDAVKFDASFNGKQ